ncbi:MAG TPA: HAMP domain-containing sensor histidine kinase [Burkholderiaceae bacterium]|nr:HAMP domain-containing sensor histidine kinase [Burkholderiaceae bacterium]
MHTLRKDNDSTSLHAWIESESIQQEIALVLGTQSSAILAGFAFFALLWTHKPFPIWLGAALVHVVVFVIRVWFFKKSKRLSPSEASHFYVTHIYVVGLIGLTWGLTTLLVNEQAPSNTELLGHVIILVYATASTIYLSRHLPSMRLFIASFIGGLLIASFVRWVLDHDFSFSLDHTVLFLVSLILGFVLLRFGEQLNKSHITTLTLQFQNTALLKSTTQERDAALAAIESKNRILACTAHDMRQPVLALDIYTKWLQEDPHLSEEITPKIASATRDVLLQFNALYDLAELNQNQTVVNIQSVHLKTLIEEICMQHQAVAMNKGLELRTHLLDATLETDPVLFSRLLGNIIGNAIKYSHAGGILVAMRRYHPGRLQIEVWDTGLGIPDHEQGLVFEAFYKSKAQNGTNDGFGLGLSIVAELSRLMGFTVTLRSRVNRGTMVLIDLNVKQNNPTPVNINSERL